MAALDVGLTPSQVHTATRHRLTVQAHLHQGRRFAGVCVHRPDGVLGDPLRRELRRKIPQRLDHMVRPAVEYAGAIHDDGGVRGGEHENRTGPLPADFQLLARRR
ncbi:hypothetical protein STAWA0001_0355, partial [Staphylococcus warneri L37603]